MKLLSISILVLAVIFSVSCNTKTGKQSQKKQRPQITFSENNGQKSIDVLVDGKLFTTYRWPDNI